LLKVCRHGSCGIDLQAIQPTEQLPFDDDMADRVIKLLRSTYADGGPTSVAEKLRTKHGIDLAKETVRRLQIAVGLWIPRKLRPPKIQQPRLRRACIGELIQIDGCEHHWFEDRGPECTTLVFIDDATSRLMQILFNGTESTFGYFEATRRYIDQHGKPTAFYSDKASIFRVNKASATGSAKVRRGGRANIPSLSDGRVWRSGRGMNDQRRRPAIRLPRIATTILRFGLGDTKCRGKTTKNPYSVGPWPRV
jgi:hypothetical protein